MSTAQHRAASTAFLRRLPLFDGLDDVDIDRIAALARRVHFAAGTRIMEEGTPGDGLYIVAAGEIEVRRRDGDQDIPLAVRTAGEFVGELSLLGEVPRTATVVALDDVEALVIDPDSFQLLLAASPHVMRSVLRTVAERMQSTESLLMAREKLASLGTMAAGLAHELNNPAAAIVRATDHLHDAFGALQRATTEIATRSLSPAQMQRLDELTAEAGTCQPTSADPLVCSAEEESIAEWLEAHGVTDSWDVAPPLVGYGWTRERMEALADVFTGEQIVAVVRWLCTRLSARTLLDEIERSAVAMSGIVAAVREYAYLDRAPVQDVDLVDSLENTLVILRYRLKEGITIVRDYAADLPRVEAWGSELNQVWTNLITNAADALGGRGTITLRTRRDGEHVSVEVIDDGPGIPDAIRSRILDPFFTTKPPGVGSGLGLHIVYNTVVRRHRGGLHFDSRPGRTRFCVTLPVRLRRESA